MSTLKVSVLEGDPFHYKDSDGGPGGVGQVLTTKCEDTLPPTGDRTVGALSPLRAPVHPLDDCPRGRVSVLVGRRVFTDTDDVRARS